jgi:hypothetical protein
MQSVLNFMKVNLENDESGMFLLIIQENKK